MGLSAQYWHTPKLCRDYFPFDWAFLRGHRAPFAPLLLGYLYPGAFFLYGVAILVRLAKGEVVLSHTNLGAGGRPLFLWRLIAIMLIVSALCDGLIAANFVFAHGQFTLTILSTFSGILLVGVGYLLLQPDLFPRNQKPNCLQCHVI